MTPEEKERLDEVRNLESMISASIASPAPLLRLILQLMFWFFVPFLISWGAGIDVIYAVRIAVFPWACASIALGLLGILGVFVYRIAVSRLEEIREEQSDEEMREGHLDSPEELGRNSQ